MQSLGAGLCERAESTWAHLCSVLGIGDAAARQAVGRLLAALDAEQDGRGYRALPLPFVDALAAAVHASTAPQPWCLLDLLLIGLVRQFDERFERAGLPEDLLADYRENAGRVLARAAQARGRAASVGDDIFLKDLGIFRMTLIPCASHLIYRHSGVPRGLVLRQRPADAARALAYLLRECGGFAPFMENHVHPAMLTHFNADGRERCYRLVAKLLQRWPDSRGLMGLSWYYDPAVSAVSPRLAYLRRVPERGGALFLPAGAGEDVVRGAIATSATRRRLYESGAYRPTRYLMAWSRRGLLAHCGA